MSENDLLTPYDESFFSQLESGAHLSAKQILPHLLQFITVQSALDVGCGTGAWLNVLDSLGVNDYIGIDGEYVDLNKLLIPREKFKPMDLTTPESLRRTFDLVLSLEVAEHLEEVNADTFVQFLCEHGDVILFSAACPQQGGTDHKNEQWPDYWASKFENCGFLAVDAIRPWMLANDAVEWWYSQNTLLFANRLLIQQSPLLAQLPTYTSKSIPCFVHRKLFLIHANQNELMPSFGKMVRSMPKALATSLSYRTRSLFDKKK